MDKWVLLHNLGTKMSVLCIFSTLIHRKGGVFRTYPHSYPPKLGQDVDKFTKNLLVVGGKHGLGHILSARGHRLAET